MSEIKFDGCTINGDVLKEGHVGDNIYQNIPIYLNMPTYFNEVLAKSNDSEERQLAQQAKRLCQTNNHVALKELFTNNIAAFTSGTFATVAGGLILQAITDFIK